MGGILCKAAAVHKVGSCHPQTFGTFIHLLYKGLLCTGNILRHGYRSIISRCDHNALNQCFHRLRLPFLQKNLGAAHRLGMSAGNHLIGKLDFPLCQGIKNQDQRHDLCNAGRTSFVIRPFFIYDLSRRCLHENG